MSETERKGRNQTSRREVLKKAAIVGGVAWTLPVIESVSTPAYAGSPPCERFDCNASTRPTCTCGGFAGFRALTVEGNCDDCWAEVFTFASDCSVCESTPLPTTCAPTVNCGTGQDFACLVNCTTIVP
jgi:hypothetical protein